MFTHNRDPDETFKRIVYTDESPLCVFAGPGTGKTTALQERVSRLLKDNVPPKEILVTTFTRTAANDLELALKDANVPGAESVNAGTLHSHCLRILGRNNVLPITGRVPRPLMKFEIRFLLEDLKKAEMGDIDCVENRLLAFAAAWAKDQQDEPGWTNDPKEKEFEEILLQWLVFHKAMLIDELVPETLRFLRNNPASYDRNEFSNVLVDEYQDLNKAEQRLIELLADNAHLTVIGDEDQSIYSFKHAHPDGIAEYKERNADAAQETLFLCRRCPSNIVELANQLISENSSRTPRQLKAERNNKEAFIRVVQWQGMKQEGKGIAEFVKGLIDNGQVDAGRILILSPRRQFGYKVRDELESMNVQTLCLFSEKELEGNPKNLPKSRAQQAFTLLTLLADPEDHVALRCWCGFGSDDLRSGAWSRIREYCKENELSLFEAAEKVLRKDMGSSHDRWIRDRLRKLKEKLELLAPSNGIELVDTLFPKNDEDFTQIRNALPEDLDCDADAKEILKVLGTNIVQPELSSDVDRVRIMSLYKSKGLTADLVIVLGCIEGLSPDLSDAATSEERNRALEEERRLFYVAITRARKFLVLSSVTWLRTRLAQNMRIDAPDDSPVYRTITSSFIHELGPTCPDPIHGTKLMQEFAEKS